jgi:ribosome biogenesis protein Tsr3
MDFELRKKLVKCYIWNIRKQSQKKCTERNVYRIEHYGPRVESAPNRNEYQ